MGDNAYRPSGWASGRTQALVRPAASLSRSLSVEGFDYVDELTVTFAAIPRARAQEIVERLTVELEAAASEREET